MNKIIALAVVGMFVTGCDSFDSRADEVSASTIKYALVTGRSINFDSANGGAVDGPFNGTATGGAWANFVNADGVAVTPSRSGYGRILLITTDGLLDGASIEATPQSCLQANNWLTVTTTATLPAGGTWYTCYYPSSATTDDGSSVYVFYATVAPGTATASQPIRSGTMTAGTYTFNGSFKGKGGNAITLNATVVVQ